jgi:hypothetical protein
MAACNFAIVQSANSNGSVPGWGRVLCPAACVVQALPPVATTAPATVVAE